MPKANRTDKRAMLLLLLLQSDRLDFLVRPSSFVKNSSKLKETMKSVRRLYTKRSPLNACTGMYLPV